MVDKGIMADNILKHPLLSASSALICYNVILVELFSFWALAGLFLPSAIPSSYQIVHFRIHMGQVLSQ